MLVAISIASVLLVNRARNDNGMVVHTVEVENAINTLLLEVRRAESAARGYLLTSGPEFLRDHEEAVASILPDTDKLEKLTADNTIQADNVRKLRSAIEVRLAQFARELDFVKQGQPASATALVREVAAGPTSATIRTTAEAMLAEEARLFLNRRAKADSSQVLASSVTIAGSSMVIALAGLSIFLVRRSPAPATRPRRGCATTTSTSRPPSTSAPPTCARPMTRSSALPISSATICARRW